jgi:hypothetical protein
VVVVRGSGVRRSCTSTDLPGPSRAEGTCARVSRPLSFNYSNSGLSADIAQLE